MIFHLRLHESIRNVLQRFLTSKDNITDTFKLCKKTHNVTNKGCLYQGTKLHRSSWTTVMMSITTGSTYKQTKAIRQNFTIIPANF